MPSSSDEEVSSRNDFSSSSSDHFVPDESEDEVSSDESEDEEKVGSGVSDYLAGLTKEEREMEKMSFRTKRRKKLKRLTTYTQSFREDWLKDPKFSTWVIRTQDAKKASCKYCKTVISAKRSSLKRHVETQKHINNEKPFSVSRSVSVLDNHFKPSLSKGLKLAIARIVLFIVEHCSIMSVNHLTELVRTAFPDSDFSRFQLKRTKCTAIIRNVFGPYFLSKIVEDVGEQPYSLLLDESTDISVNKMLGVVIQYISRETKEIISTFLGIIHIKDGSADTMAKAVDKYVQQVGLNPTNCIGIGSDNAAAMTGRLGGVHVLLEQLWKKKLVLMRCSCHSIELAVSAACSALPRNIEHLVKETYGWFSHSSVRIEKFRALYYNANKKDPLKILNVCATRWLSIYTSIDRILDQWDDLKSYFKETSATEKSFSAQLLYEMYCDDANLVYLRYLKYALGDVFNLSKSLQSKNDSFKIVDDLVNVIEKLAKLVVNPTTRNILEVENLRSFANPVPYFGVRCEQIISNIKNKETVKSIRSRCVDFVFTLINELKARLPNNVRVFQMIKSFSMENTLRVIKNRVTDVATMAEFNLNLETVEAIEKQWENIMSVQWDPEVVKSGDSFRFWMMVFDYRDSAGMNPFQELCDLVFILLALPISNAEVERVFSMMNIVKNKIRNRMLRKTLNAILMSRYTLLRFEKNCYTYEIPIEILNKINNMDSYKEEQEEPQEQEDFDQEMEEMEDLLQSIPNYI